MEFQDNCLLPPISLNLFIFIRGVFLHIHFMLSLIASDSSFITYFRVSDGHHC